MAFARGIVKSSKTVHVYRLGDPELTELFSGLLPPASALQSEERAGQEFTSEEEDALHEWRRILYQTDCSSEETQSGNRGKGGKAASPQTTTAQPPGQEVEEEQQEEGREEGGVVRQYSGAACQESQLPLESLQIPFPGFGNVRRAPCDLYGGERNGHRPISWAALRCLDHHYHNQHISAAASSTAAAAATNIVSPTSVPTIATAYGDVVPVSPTTTSTVTVVPSPPFPASSPLAALLQTPSLYVPEDPLYMTIDIRSPSPPSSHQLPFNILSLMEALQRVNTQYRQQQPPRTITGAPLQPPSVPSVPIMTCIQVPGSTPDGKHQLHFHCLILLQPLNVVTIMNPLTPSPQVPPPPPSPQPAPIAATAATAAPPSPSSYKTIIVQMSVFFPQEIANADMERKLVVNCQERIRLTSGNQITIDTVYTRVIYLAPTTRMQGGLADCSAQTQAVCMLLLHLMLLHNYGIEEAARQLSISCDSVQRLINRSRNMNLRRMIPFALPMMGACHLRFIIDHLMFEGCPMTGSGVVATTTASTALLPGGGRAGLEAGGTATTPVPTNRFEFAKHLRHQAISENMQRFAAGVRKDESKLSEPERRTVEVMRMHAIKSGTSLAVPHGRRIGTIPIYTCCYTTSGDSSRDYRAQIYRPEHDLEDAADSPAVNLQWHSPLKHQQFICLMIRFKDDSLSMARVIVTCHIDAVEYNKPHSLADFLSTLNVLLPRIHPWAPLQGDVLSIVEPITPGNTSSSSMRLVQVPLVICQYGSFAHLGEDFDFDDTSFMPTSQPRAKMYPKLVIDKHVTSHVQRTILPCSVTSLLAPGSSDALQCYGEWKEWERHRKVAPNRRLVMNPFTHKHMMDNWPQYMHHRKSAYRPTSFLSSTPYVSIPDVMMNSDSESQQSRSVWQLLHDQMTGLCRQWGVSVMPVMETHTPMHMFLHTRAMEHHQHRMAAAKVIDLDRMSEVVKTVYAIVFSVAKLQSGKPHSMLITWDKDTPLSGLFDNELFRLFGGTAQGAKWRNHPQFPMDMSQLPILHEMVTSDSPLLSHVYFPSTGSGSDSSKAALRDVLWFKAWAKGRVTAARTSDFYATLVYPGWTDSKVVPQQHPYHMESSNTFLARHTTHLHVHVTDSCRVLPRTSPMPPISWKTDQPQRRLLLSVYCS